MTYFVSVAFCGALLGDSRFFNSTWLDSALSINSAKPCIERTVKICKHNETMEVVGEMSEEFETWKEDWEKKDESMNGRRRVKRSDVELPG